jgi:hypothetical protein
MVLDSDLDRIAELALLNLDGGVLALFVLAACAGVGRGLCIMLASHEQKPVTKLGIERDQTTAQHVPTRDTTMFVACSFER